jgi:hypothetical protein
VTGSRALGACIRRHRVRCQVKAFANKLDKSERWLVYLEAGHTVPDWDDLVAIATALGPDDGGAFLNEAAPLLYEEAHMDLVNRQIMQAVEGRQSMAVLGTGAMPDSERVERVLQGLGVDAGVVQELRGLTGHYAEKSRSDVPGMVVMPTLQAHLRNHLELANGASNGLGDQLKRGASEAALLIATLMYRADLPSEALRFSLLASALAKETGYHAIHACVLAVRECFLYCPSTRGGDGGDPIEARRLLDQALDIMGRRLSPSEAVTMYSWRAVQFAMLGDAAAADEDLDAAATALSKWTATDRDLLGMGVANELDLKVEHAICAVYLRRPQEAIADLSEELSQAGRTPGWKAARLADLAAAHAQVGDGDQAVALLLEAMDLMKAAKDPWRMRRIQGTRRRWLADFTSGDDVEELDRRLAVAAG